jgi:hypothetical protein
MQTFTNDPIYIVIPHQRRPYAAQKSDFDAGYKSDSNGPDDANNVLEVTDFNSLIDAMRYAGYGYPATIGVALDVAWRYFGLFPKCIEFDVTEGETDDDGVELDSGDYRLAELTLRLADADIYKADIDAAKRNS